MKELQDIAAAKASQRLEKAKSNTHKKKSKTTSKTKSKNSVNIDEENDSSSDAASEKNDNENKKRSKSSKAKSSNYCDPLKQHISQMSKTERKQYKQIQREFCTYYGVKIDIPDNNDGITCQICLPEEGSEDDSVCNRRQQYI